MNSVSGGKRKMFLMLGLIILGGCTVTNTFDAVRLNQQAQLYFKHGQYDKAMELLKDSLVADPENSATHYWLGRCHEVTGQKQKTVWAYKDAVRYDPSMELAQMALIKTYYRMDKKDEAIQAARLFLQHKEGLAGDFILIGDNFYAEQMEEPGELAYLAAARAEPGNAGPFIFLANRYQAQGDQEKEVEYLKRALRAQPYNVEVTRRLGKLGYRVELPKPKLFPRPSKLEEELFELEN